MKKIIIYVIIIIRLITNDGLILENKRSIPKKQSPEVFRFVRRPARKGKKIFE